MKRMYICSVTIPTTVVMILCFSMLQPSWASLLNQEHNYVIPVLIYCETVNYSTLNCIYPCFVDSLYQQWGVVTHKPGYWLGFTHHSLHPSDLWKGVWGLLLALLFPPTSRVKTSLPAWVVAALPCRGVIAAF